MRQKLVFAAVAILFAAAGVLAYQWRVGLFDRGPEPVAAGQRLFTARLTGVDGSAQTLEKWRGKVLVVNFWATWCAPCREEIPEFIKFQANYGDKGVQFVGIAVDTPERVSIYAKEMGINYPLLVGGIESMELAREVGDRAGVLPYSLVVDRSGRVVTYVVGVLRPDRLEKILIPLL
jgi:thiol-disulfide isomerase/thioredoxin